MTCCQHFASYYSYWSQNSLQFSSLWFTPQNHQKKETYSVPVHIKKLHHTQATRGPHGQSLTQFLKQEAAESIATPPPPGWDASPLQVDPHQYVVGTHFIHLGEELQDLWGYKSTAVAVTYHLQPLRKFDGDDSNSSQAPVIC